MAVLLILLAALFASISNFCMRKSIDAGGSAKAYLVTQMTLSFFIMVLLNPVRTGVYVWDWYAVVLGLICGLILGLLMWSLGKALENGPPGLTFAALNSASVMPGAIMALFFGIAFGHVYTSSQAIGSFFVIAGLFWAGWSIQKSQNKGLWIFFATLTFVVHVLFLAYLQWWAMLSKDELPKSVLLPIHIPQMNSQWFMPAMLFMAAIIQWGIFLAKEARKPKGSEIVYGTFGGICNGVCTFLMIVSAQLALGWENAMIFPIFSVSIIVICNIWGQALYKEQVNWKANVVCILGLIIGTVAWQQI